MNTLKLLRTACLSATAAVVAPAVTAAQDTGLGTWDWGVEVYFWAADLGGKTTSGGDVNLKIDDILDSFKFGFMGAVAAQRNDWLMFADALYIDIGDTKRATANVGPIAVNVKGDIDLKAFASTFGAGYRVAKTTNTTLHAIGGVRFLWFDGTVTIDATESIFGSPIDGQTIRDKAVDTSWDAIIGLRGKTDLNDKWYVSYYGDIGAGNSDLTWQALVAVNYRMKWADITLGYRYADWKLNDFKPFDELNLGGPFLGAKFRF